jgi:hypothetical protein
MSGRAIDRKALLFLLVVALVGLALAQGRSGADPCQAILDAYRSAEAKLQAAQDVFNRTPEPSTTLMSRWVEKENIKPADFESEAAKRREEMNSLQAKCSSGQAFKDEKERLDKLKSEIVPELDSLAAFYKANASLQAARSEFSQAEEAYGGLTRAKDAAMTKAKASVAKEKDWLKAEKERLNYPNLKDAAKRQAARSLASHAADALKPIKADLDKYGCLTDAARYLEKLQKNILRYEGLRASVASDAGENLADLTGEIDLSDLDEAGFSSISLPVPVRAALAVALCAYSRDDAPSLYQGSPAFNPGRAPSYLKTYRPGQYYSLTLSREGRIIEICIYQFADTALAQGQLRAWQSSGGPAKAARNVGWSPPGLPISLKPIGVQDETPETRDNIVVRGCSGAWILEVSVLTNQMSLAPAKPAAAKEETARVYIQKLIENARSLKLL